MNGQLVSIQTNYNKQLLQNAKGHKIVEKLHKIYGKMNGSLSSDNKKVLEGLDKTCSELMRNTEKKCRKVAMGDIDFSPKVNEIRGQRLLLLASSCGEEAIW
jgi:hypothetical protein